MDVKNTLIALGWSEELVEEFLRSSGALRQSIPNRSDELNSQIVGLTTDSNLVDSFYDEPAGSNHLLVY